MSRDDAEHDGTRDYDLFDGPMPRYRAADAVVRLGDETYDLNALEHALASEETGRPSLHSLRAPDDDERAAEQAARVGRRLRALREDHQVSQQDAARKAGLMPARLRALERGATDARMSEIAGLARAVGGTISDVAPDAPEVALRRLARHAEEADVPRDLVHRIAHTVGRRGILRALERAFGWAREDITHGRPTTAKLRFDVRFKSRAGDQPRESPLLVLTRTLSESVAAAYSADNQRIPKDPLELRQLIVDRDGALTLSSVLRWAWEAGVVVLPVAARAGFSAAAWKVGSRPVVVLNESYAPGAFWLFDLAHELGHLALGHVDEKAVIDVDAVLQVETGDVVEPRIHGVEDEEERAANAYALALLLGTPDELIAEVRRRAAGSAAHRKFKFKVIDVAREASVSPAVLGLAAAHELIDVARPRDRWGSAINIAKEEDPDGHGHVQKALLDYVAVTELPPLDAELLRAVAPIDD